MRILIRDFVKVCADTLPIPGPVYEFGSFIVPGQEELADLRPLFPSKEYIGADMRPGPGVDVVLNLHEIDLPSASCGLVILADTIEHVEFPRQAIAEVHRTLSSDGVLLISSVMNFPIHEFPHDYWRFTPQGFQSLLSHFHTSLVQSVGRDDFPHTVVGIGFKSPQRMGS